MTTIRLGLSQAFLNKSLREGFDKRAFGNSFAPSEITPDELAAHILAGNAWTPGYFDGNTRKNKTFISAQAIPLDIEPGSIVQALEKPLIRETCFIAHASGSSGIVTEKNPNGDYRSRVIVFLNEPVEGFERWRTMAHALAEYLGLEGVDPASWKPAQLYYGSTNRVEPPYLNMDARQLTVEFVGGLTADMARAEMERELAPKPPMMQPTPENASRFERYAAAAKERMVADYLAVPTGRKLRHDAFIILAAGLIGMAKGDWPGFSGVESELRSIGQSTGRDNGEIDRAIRWAWDNADEKRLELPDEKRPKRSVQARRRKEAERQTTAAPKPAALATIAADQTVNSRYLSADLLGNHPALAVVSDVDTGKTTAVIELARRCAGKVIYLTHREKLATNFANAAQAKGVIFEHYRELRTQDIGRVSRLAICINTYAALAELPKADLLIIDEGSQVLSHIFETGETFESKTGEALTAGEALEWAAKNAGQLVVMDAHLDREPLETFKRIRPDLFVLRNDFHAERGPLTIYEGKDDCIDAGIALVKADEGTVVFACAAAGDGTEKPGKGSAAQLAEELLQALEDPEAVLLLTANNSGGERQRAFLNDPNGQMSRYRAIVHSPVIGTGFDITAPVRAVVTIGSGQLTAYDHRQMAGRCRNARELHVYLPSILTPLETDPAELATAELDRYAMTGRRITEAGRSIPAVDERQRHYLDIHSQMMARRNRSMNAQRAHFMALAAGYTVTWQPKSQPAAESRKERAEAAESRLKELTLTAAPVDRATFKRLRDQGQVTLDARAGFIRQEMEHATGLVITEEVRDRLWAKGVSQLKALTDLLDDYAELIAYDAQQKADGVPLPRLAHRTVRREVRAAFLKKLLTSDGQPVEFSKAELETALTPLIQQYHQELRRYFGWRPDQCRGAAATARRVLAGMGLELDSDQHGKKRVRYYRLGKTTLAAMLALARQRLATLNARRSEKPGYLKVPFEPEVEGMGVLSTPRIRQKSAARPLDFEPAHRLDIAAMKNPFVPGWQKAAAHV